MAEFFVPLRKKIKDSLTTRLVGKACKIEGASIEKDWQKGKKRNEYFLLREHTSKS